MKKLLFAATATLLCAAAFFAGRRSTNTTTYAKHGRVTGIDRVTDVVTFADAMGYEWSFYGVEDWMIDDGVSAVMDDNGTDTIFDDKVVNVRYEN